MLLYIISVCLRTRRDTISYSSDIYSSETGTSIDKYGKERRVWSMAKEDEYGVWSMEYLRLTIGFSLSVRSPGPPPRPIEDIVVVSVFYTVRRPRSANQRSRMCTWHLADQSAIASPTVQRATSDQPFAILSRDLA